MLFRSQAPSLRSASKLHAQLVEPGVPISPTTHTKQNPASLQRRGFVVWYQWPGPYLSFKSLFILILILLIRPAVVTFVVTLYDEGSNDPSIYNEISS